MTSYNDINEGYKRLNHGANKAISGLIYTCNCGWLDLGHAFHPATDPLIGAANLWRQIQAESPLDARLSFGYDYPPGWQSYGYPHWVLNLMRDDRLARFPDGATGYRVTFREEMPVPHTGLKTGVTKSFLVRRGLTPMARQQVTLSIFVLVSRRFESLQLGFEWGGIGDYVSRHLMGRPYDSGFSREDLVSNLIGFHVAVGAMTRQDALDLWHPVSRETAERIWQTEGPVGARKNFGFEPDLAESTAGDDLGLDRGHDDCLGQPRAFPAAFQSIHPARPGRNFIELREGW